MRAKNKILMLLLLTGLLAASCSKNYYSSKAKSSDCGCPAKKGMVGY